MQRAWIERITNSASDPVHSRNSARHLARALPPSLHESASSDQPLQLRARGSAEASSHTDAPARTSSIPHALASGIRALSGLDVSGVRVHHGSALPARFGAHAFARAPEIHVAPGQDHQLPHEAWHVVQQLQGRVPTTSSIAGARANLDAKLEREADVMGQRALSPATRMHSGAGAGAERSASSSPTMQLARNVGVNQSYATFGDAVTEAQGAFGANSGRIQVRLYLDAVNRQDNVNFSFNMSAQGRWAGSTWVSNDVDLGGNAVLHFTCSLDRLAITHATGAAQITLSNFHSTVRTAVDSARMEVMAAAHVGNPAGLAAEPDYATIQGRSVHRGPGGAAWNSGNPANTNAALAHIGLPAATLNRFSGANITRLRNAFGDALTDTLVGRTIFGTAIQTLAITW